MASDVYDHYRENVELKYIRNLKKIKYDTYDIMKYLLLSDKRLAKKKIDVERLVHELYDIFYLGIDHKKYSEIYL